MNSAENIHARCTCSAKVYLYRNVRHVKHNHFVKTSYAKNVDRLYSQNDFYKFYFVPVYFVFDE